MNAIDILPDELRGKSYHENEIVLPYADALLAIDYLEKANLALLGWKSYRTDGNRTILHGAFGMIPSVGSSPEQDRTWDDIVRTKAEKCRGTVKLNQKRFDKDPYFRKMTLLFRLTAVSEQDFPGKPLT